MVVKFQVIPSRGMVYIKYSGVARIDETMVAVKQLSQHPDYEVGLRHMFDVADVTDIEKDFAKFFNMQAQLLDIYTSPPGEQLFAYYAPTKIGQIMAHMAQISVDMRPEVIIKTFETEADTLEFLGQPETSLHALFEDAI